MNILSQTLLRNRFVPICLLSFIWGIATFYFGQSVEGKETLYLVIKPGLSKDMLTQIADRLKSKQVLVTYPQLHFEANQLHAITVQIEVLIPDQPPRTFTISETADASGFEPIVFYCLWEEKRIGLVKATSAELTPQEQQLATRNLNGLLIKTKGSREIIGSLQSNRE